MALDAVTYGRVEEAEEKILNNLNDVKSTVDTLPEKVEQKLDPVQTDMAQLVENVQKQVEEMQTAVQNAPVGGPMPYVLDTGNFSAKSVENGIKLTYKATIHEKLAWAVNVPCGSVPPYGIMIRYGTEGFPRTPNEGILAVDDTDIVDKTTKGPSNSNGLYGKTKTFTVVGLTSNTLYYFSAFPYSYDKVFNTNYGLVVDGLAGTYQESNNTQRKTCKWTGTKGTLTVNVTQDYDYKPLGEYTATLTPTAGGAAITKTQSGATTVVFSGLEAGQYTLSFSAPQYFTAPQSQSVTVVAGQSQTSSVEFNTSNNLNDYSWVELSNISKNNDASKIFSVGSTKQININYFTGDLPQKPSYSSKSINVELVDINKDTRKSGGKNTMSFITKNFAGYARFSSISPWRELSTVREFFQENKEKIFPSDLCSVMSSVVKKTGYYDGNTPVTTNDFVFIPSVSELGIDLGRPQDESPKDYSYFTDSSRRIKSEGSYNNSYITRTSYNNLGVEFVTITNTGDKGSSVSFGSDRYIPLGFCI